MSLGTAAEGKGAAIGHNPHTNTYEVLTNDLRGKTGVALSLPVVVSIVLKVVKTGLYVASLDHLIKQGGHLA